MSDDLIKRSDAIEAFCIDCRNQDKPCEHEATCKTMRILRNKKKLPSADRPSDPHDITYINALKNRIRELEAKRPQGEWIGGPVEHGPGYTCSICHYRVPPWNNTPYCPNCGAKMKGKAGMHGSCSM